jgi:hypothetical protein
MLSARFVIKYIALNITIVVIACCILSLEYLACRTKTVRDYLSIAEEIKSLIRRDLLLISHFVDTNIKNVRGKNKSLQSNKFLQESLSIYSPSIIKIHNAKETYNEHMPYILLETNDLSGNGLKIRLKQQVRVNSELEFTFDFYTNDFIERAGGHSVGKDLIFAIKIKDVDNQEWNKLSATQKKSIVKLLQGTDFELNMYPKILSFVDFFIGNGLEGSLRTFLLLLCFNLGCIFLFNRETINIKHSSMVELENLCGLLGQKAREVRSLQKESIEQCKLKDGLLRSYDVFQEETFKLYEEIREFLRYIGSCFKIDESINDPIALREAFRTFNNFNFEHLANTAGEEKLDICAMVERAIGINMYILMKRSIGITKKYNLKGITVYGNYLILIRVLSSILYKAIYTSKKGSKISVKISKINRNDGKFIILEIQDYGYRLKQDVEVCINDEKYNFSKLNIEDVIKISSEFDFQLELEESPSLGNVSRLYIPIRGKAEQQDDNIIHISKLR